MVKGVGVHVALSHLGVEAPNRCSLFTDLDHSQATVCFLIPTHHRKTLHSGAG